MNDSRMSSVNRVTFDFNTIDKFESIFHAIGIPNFSAYKYMIIILLLNSTEIHWSIIFVNHTALTVGGEKINKIVVLICYLNELGKSNEQAQTKIQCK